MAGNAFETAIEAARRLETELRALLDPADAAALLAQARERRAAGREVDALEILDRAISASPEPVLRGEIQRLRGQILRTREQPLIAYELLVSEAAAVEPYEPGLAAQMLADAALAGAGSTGGVAVATRALALAHRSGDEAASAYAEFALGLSSMLGGDAEAADVLVRRALDRFESTGAQLETDRYQNVGATLLWVEEYETVRLVLDRMVDRARASALNAVPGLLDTLAAVDYRTGSWNSAEARSTEALRLAREFEQGSQAASCLTTLARVAAARGREGECRALAAEAMSMVQPADLTFAYAVSALGLLEIGLGRAEAAIVELERLQGSGFVFYEPMIVLWLPDLIEAYVRAGRRPDAAEALATLEEQTRDRGREGALAATARCRGLLAESGEFEEPFERALELHAKTPTPFERARTELCLGERLRRARRGAEGKPYLLAALGTFERLGAIPWAERARRELGRRRAGSEGLESLTPHEREVAALVTRGATNREAAAALFVSPKTIEYHLASAYRKLEVRSRTELAVAVRDQLS